MQSTALQLGEYRSEVIVKMILAVQSQWRYCGRVDLNYQPHNPSGKRTARGVFDWCCRKWLKYLYQKTVERFCFNFLSWCHLPHLNK